MRQILSRSHGAASFWVLGQRLARGAKRCQSKTSAKFLRDSSQSLPQALPLTTKTTSLKVPIRKPYIEIVGSLRKRLFWWLMVSVFDS